jgi:hypothetical protein
LSKTGLGLAFGILWGASMLVLGLTAYLIDWGTAFVHIMSSIYVGFHISIAGSFIGALWGFVDAFIAGFIIAWLYNIVIRHCCCCKKK